MYSREIIIIIIIIGAGTSNLGQSLKRRTFFYFTRNIKNASRRCKQESDANFIEVGGIHQSYLYKETRERRVLMCVDSIQPPISTLHGVKWSCCFAIGLLGQVGQR